MIGRRVRGQEGYVAIPTKPTFRTDAFIDGAFRPAESGDKGLEAFEQDTQKKTIWFTLRS
jgi:hypothetical protein